MFMEIRGGVEKNMLADNLKKVLFEVFKKAFVITDDKSFDLNTHFEGNETQTIKIEAMQWGQVFLAVSIAMEKNGKPLICIEAEQQGQIQFFAGCLIDAFWMSYQRNAYRFIIKPVLAEEFVQALAQEIYRKGSRIFSDKLKDNFKIDIEIIQNISSLYYEGESCQGWLFFSFLPDFKPTLTLSSKYDENRKLFAKDNSRGIRKMLEITKTEAESKPLSALILSYDESKKWKMQGMADIDVESASGIWVHFISHMVWEMGYQGNKIVNYRNGFLEFPIQQGKEQFLEKMKEIAEPEGEFDDLWYVVEAAKKQRHGTILIIFCNGPKFIDKEVTRLMGASSGNGLEEPVSLNEKLILQISAIDGAVIMDSRQLVYGYGFILDSSAKIKGESSRGARYNCSRKYIASLACRKAEAEAKALAVIISEDGMVNFYSTKDYRREDSDEKH